MFLVTVSALCGCKKGAKSQQDGLVSVDSGRFVVMGTFGRIQLDCRNEKLGIEAIASAKQALDELDRLLSTYRDDSELAKINKLAANEPVAVSAETYCILQKSLEYSRLTGGAFDITVAPLLELYESCAKADRTPSEEELSETRKVVGYQKVLLNTERMEVKFAATGVKINVNAIAKGHAVDQVLAAVRTEGIEAGLVDIGGEIACFGQYRRDRDWLVGVQDPFAPENDDQLSEKPGWILSLKDCAVATSGNYRRYYEINGQKISHIIDPRTGRSAEALPSVTIIAPLTIDADALATAISVMGTEKGIKLIETIPHTEAFIVMGRPENTTLVRSSGFEKFEQDKK